MAHFQLFLVSPPRLSRRHVYHHLQVRGAAAQTRLAREGDLEDHTRTTHRRLFLSQHEHRRPRHPEEHGAHEEPRLCCHQKGRRRLLSGALQARFFFPLFLSLFLIGIGQDIEQDKRAEVWAVSGKKGVYPLLFQEGNFLGDMPMVEELNEIGELAKTLGVEGAGPLTPSF